MMFCRASGSLVDHNANFCKDCGKGAFLNLYVFPSLLVPNSDRHVRSSINNSKNILHFDRLT